MADIYYSQAAAVYRLCSHLASFIVTGNVTPPHQPLQCLLPAPKFKLSLLYTRPPCRLPLLLCCYFTYLQRRAAERFGNKAVSVYFTTTFAALFGH